MARRRRDRFRYWHYFVDAITQGILIYAALTSALSEHGMKVPIFNTHPNNVTFSVGETASLTCSIQNLQTRYVYWMKMSEPNPITVGTFVYSPDSRFSVQKNEASTQWNLMIRDVKLTDAGAYFCAVSAGPTREKYRRLIMLRVNEVTTSPPGITIDGTEFVNKGRPIRLQCNATGSLRAPEVLDWFKNGKRIDARYTRKIKISYYRSIETRTMTSTLYIKRSEMVHQGTYMCRNQDLNIASMSVHVLDEGTSVVIKRDEDTKAGRGSQHQQRNGSSVLCGSFMVIVIQTFFVLLTEEVLHLT